MSFGSRLVLDTSTLVSALLKPQSIPARALGYAREFFTVIVSPATVDELSRVLGRDFLSRYRSAQEREIFLREYRLMAETVEVVETVRACRDSNDDKFLSLAVSGQAVMIVSSDLDLLSMGQYGGIAILTPRAFVTVCEGGP